MLVWPSIQPIVKIVLLPRHLTLSQCGIGYCTTSGSSVSRSEKDSVYGQIIYIMHAIKHPIAKLYVLPSIVPKSVCLFLSCSCFPVSLLLFLILVCINWYLVHVFSFINWFNTVIWFVKHKIVDAIIFVQTILGIITRDLQTLVWMDICAMCSF